MGLTALISVSVPLAVVWGVLGIWLGRQQERQANRASISAGTAEPASIERNAIDGIPTMQHP
jgi:hypothetical protein